MSKDMGEKVRTILIRIIGSLYGVYGVIGIALLGWLVDQGVLRILDSGLKWFSIPWSFTRAFLCLLVGWFAWRQPRRTPLLAWGVLAMFLIGVLSDSTGIIRSYRLDFWRHYVPGFYTAVVAQIIAAAFLTYLSQRNYKSQLEV
jgi:hypothetical protein